MQSLHAGKHSEIKADSQRENPEVTTLITPSSALHSRVETLLPKLKLKPVMPYSDLPVLPVWVGRWRGGGLRPPAAWAVSSTLGSITSGTNPSPDPIPSSKAPSSPGRSRQGRHLDLRHFDVAAPQQGDNCDVFPAENCE